MVGTRWTVLGAGLLLWSSVISPAQAAIFDALIDINALDGQAEAGAVIATGLADMVSGDLATTALSTLGGDPFTLAIAPVDANGTRVGSIDWRDRGNAGTLPLTRLAEDFVKNGAGVVRVTLGGLPAGFYRASSYHIDPIYSQSERIKVFVSDGYSAPFRDTGAIGNASFATGDAGAPGVGGLTTAIVEGTKADFSFVANGTSDVAILFDARTATDRESPLNGLRIFQAPKPPLFSAQLDFGPSTQRVETGFAKVGEAAPDVNGTPLAPTTVLAASGDPFTVALSSVDWRDRGDTTSTAPLARLAEDLVKNNAGNITLTLGDLPAGNYLATSYHLDPGTDQCPAIEVYVTDVLGVDVRQSVLGNADFIVPLGSITTQSVLQTSATFSFCSNGVDDVVIRFKGTGNDLEVPLNGLTIQQVPEPSAWTLMALGVLGGFVVRRFRNGRA
jgi:hypothetical protein